MKPKCLLNISGEQRALREKKIEMSEVLFSIARVIEVSLESSFQPTIQVTRASPFRKKAEATSLIMTV